MLLSSERVFIDKHISLCVNYTSHIRFASCKFPCDSQPVLECLIDYLMHLFLFLSYLWYETYFCCELVVLMKRCKDRKGIVMDKQETINWGSWPSPCFSYETYSPWCWCRCRKYDQQRIILMTCVSNISVPSVSVFFLRLWSFQSWTGCSCLSNVFYKGWKPGR